MDSGRGGKKNMSNKSRVSVPDKIWSILEKISAMQKEASVRQKAIDRQIEATSQQMEKRSAEADQRMKNFERNLEKTRSIFETQWGKLVESLVEGKLIKLLRERGIKVRQTSQGWKFVIKKQMAVFKGGNLILLPSMAGKL